MKLIIVVEMLVKDNLQMKEQRMKCNVKHLKENVMKLIVNILMQDRNRKKLMRNRYPKELFRIIIQDIQIQMEIDLQEVQHQLKFIQGRFKIKKHMIKFLEDK
jgi:hypothetical protein